MSIFLDKKKYVLMSIKPVYATFIKNGEKTVELRRTLPQIKNGDVIVFYESAPVQQITMTCTVKGILRCAPHELWRKAGIAACVDQKSFDAYFQGKNIANGIQLGNVNLLPKPLTLNEVIDNRRAPQSYYYLKEKETEKLQALDII